MTPVIIYNATSGGGTRFSAESAYNIPYDYTQFKKIEVFVRLYETCTSFVIDLEHRLGSGSYKAGITADNFYSGNHLHYYAIAQVNAARTILIPQYCGYYDTLYTVRNERNDNSDYLVTKVLGYK